MVSNREWESDYGRFLELMQEEEVMMMMMMRRRKMLDGGEWLLLRNGWYCYAT